MYSLLWQNIHKQRVADIAQVQAVVVLVSFNIVKKLVKQVGSV